jgi:hypothetical protein
MTKKVVRVDGNNSVMKPEGNKKLAYLLESEQFCRPPAVLRLMVQQTG